MNINFNPTQVSPGASGFPARLDQLPGSTPGLSPDKSAKLGSFGDSLLGSLQGVGKSDPSAMQGGGLVKELISGVDAKQEAVRASFLAGESGNLHQTMIASQEASVAFTLMVEMRNKVMEAYQELMRIQI